MSSEILIVDDETDVRGPAPRGRDRRAPGRARRCGHSHWVRWRIHNSGGRCGPTVRHHHQRAALPVGLPASDPFCLNRQFPAPQAFPFSLSLVPSVPFPVPVQQNRTAFRKSLSVSVESQSLIYFIYQFIDNIYYSAEVLRSLRKYPADTRWPDLLGVNQRSCQSENLCGQLKGFCSLLLPVSLGYLIENIYHIKKYEFHIGIAPHYHISAIF